MQTRINAIIPFVAGADFTGKEGHAVRYDNATGKIVEAGTSEPLGILNQSGPADETMAVAIVGAAGTFKVRLGAAAQIGNHLVVDAGTHGSQFFPLDLSTPGDQHERYRCAIALEDGAADELVEAILYTPVQISNPA